MNNISNGLQSNAPESMVETNGTLEHNGKDNNNLPTNLRMPFPSSYGRGLDFGGQPIPPSLRQHLPPDFLSSISANPGIPSFAENKDTPSAERHSKSPDEIRVRSPNSLQKLNFDAAPLKPHREEEEENIHDEDVGGDNDDAEDIIDNTKPRTNPIEQPITTKGSALIRPNSESTATTRSTESIAT